MEVYVKSYCLSCGFLLIFSYGRVLFWESGNVWAVPRRRTQKMWIFIRSDILSADCDMFMLQITGCGRHSHTQTSQVVCEADFVIHAQLTLLQGETNEVEVHPFPCRHLDVPLAAGVVAVGAGVAHRGYGATFAGQIRRPSTTRCCTKRTEVNVVPTHTDCLDKVGKFRQIVSYCAHCRCPCGWHLRSKEGRLRSGWTRRAFCSLCIQ